MNKPSDNDSGEKKKPRINDTVVDSTIIDSRPAGGLTGTLREGDAIGPYTVVRELGEGGFGSVYLCQQVKPVKRKVAVKIIKAGMDSKAVLTRFEAERQALAVLNHPSIAKVFDAGVTDNHRPYFVMEFVAGVPINEFCDDRKLDTRTRLELFAKVCDGMQHAHQKGIIHRDLKPGNILVYAEEGEAPQPKIIDFGIAKATGEDLTEETLVTQVGQMMGTPEYMSPEQASGLVNEMDTRTDVYSLGVVLYQLICGRLPFEPDELRARGYSEIQRIICEEDPPRPAQKFTSVSKKVDETTEQIATARNTTIVALTSSLRRELEWIPLKALRKEPEQRYASAESFGEDVRRYLKGEALEAGPETTSYRLKKTLKRYRGPVIAAALVTLALIGGVIASTIFAIEAKEQARIAQEKTAQVQKQAEDMKVMLDFQSQQLSSIDVPAMGDSLEEIMTNGFGEDDFEFDDFDFTGTSLSLLNDYLFIPSLLRIEEKFVDQPLIQAHLYQSISRSLFELGLIEESSTPQFDALKIRRAELPKNNADLLESMYFTGEYLIEVSRYEEAESMLMETLEGRVAADPDDPRISQTMSLQGILYLAWGRLDQAREVFEDVLVIQRQNIGDENPETLSTIANLGNTLLKLGRNEEAIPYYQEAVDGFRRTLGDNDLQTLAVMNNYGNLLGNQGEEIRAVEYLETVLEKRRQLLGDAHPDTLSTTYNIGFLLKQMGDFQRANSYLEDSVSGYVVTLGENHPNTRLAMVTLGANLKALGRNDDAIKYLSDVASIDGATQDDPLQSFTTMRAKYDMARMLGNDGDYQGSLEKFEEALELISELPETFRYAYILVYKDMGRILDAWSKAEPESDHGYASTKYLLDAISLQREIAPEDRAAILDSLVILTKSLYRQRRFEESLPHYMERLTIERDLLGDKNAETLTTMFITGWILIRQDQTEEARPLLEECLNTRRQVLGDEHPETLEVVHHMGRLFKKLGEHEAARSFFEESIQGRRRILGRHHRDTLSSVRNLGAMLKDLNEYDDATSYYVECVEICRSMYGPEHEETVKSLRLLGSLLITQKRYEEALPCYREAMEIRTRVLGSEHPDTLSTVHSMGYLLAKSGNHEQARQYYEKALETLRLVMGNEHSKTIMTLNNLGITLRTLGEYAQSMACLEEVLSVHKSVYGLASPKAIVAMRQLVKLYDAWHEADPEGEHNAKAAEYRQLIEATEANSDSLVP